MSKEMNSTRSIKANNVKQGSIWYHYITTGKNHPGLNQGPHTYSNPVL